MKIHQLTGILFLIPILFPACQYSPEPDHPSSGEAKSMAVASDPFGDYWYQGKAEITSYELKQARYGEIRDGHAVLVFVTEPFSRKKQVKLDNPSTAGSDKVSVMKLNFTRKFLTGIYPYSIMQSTFTPVQLDQYANSLKSTLSVQEWCGQVFGQLNKAGNHFRYQGFSYFESEGDVERELDLVALEDELWARIRINPESLPTGLVELIPGMAFGRLTHRDLKAEKAEASLEKGEEEFVYTLNYTTLKRRLSIRFSSQFPYEILGWEETYPDFGKMMTTTAVKKASLLTDYWTRNGNDDLHLRKELGLEKK
jgi:hypothetical protein